MLFNSPFLKNAALALAFPFLFSFVSSNAQMTTAVPEYITYYNEGVVAEKNKDFQAAIDHYKEALALKADFSDAWNNMGYCYRMLAQTYLTESGEAYAKALHYDPQHEGALEYQGEYFLMLGELKNAYENYKMLKKIKSHEAKALQEAMDPVLKQAQAILKGYSP